MDQSGNITCWNEHGFWGQRDGFQLLIYCTNRELAASSRGPDVYLLVGFIIAHVSHAGIHFLIHGLTKTSQCGVWDGFGFFGFLFCFILFYFY